MRRRLQVGERELVGSAAQHQVEQALGPDPGGEGGQHLGRVAPLDRRAWDRGLAPRRLGGDEVVDRGDVRSRPWPVTIPVSRSSVCHSSGISSGRSSTGGE